MSKPKNKEDLYYFSAGVFKFESRHVSYPMLKEIADEWVKDPNFYEITIRFVSEKNMGIQFFYVKKEDGTDPMGDHMKVLKERFGEGFYAFDFQHWSNQELKAVQGFSVVMKTLDLGPT